MQNQNQPNQMKPEDKRNARPADKARDDKANVDKTAKSDKSCGC